MLLFLSFWIKFCSVVSGSGVDLISVAMTLQIYLILGISMFYHFFVFESNRLIKKTTSTPSAVHTKLYAQTMAAP
jgi:hypothetical protein